MDVQQSQDTKKYSKAALTVTLACAAVALAMTISGFLPFMVFDDGTKGGIFNVISEVGFVGFISEKYLRIWAGYCILPQTVAIVWSAIPKKWAAIVGTAYGALLVAWSFFVYAAFIAGVDELLPGGFIFRACASLLLLALSIAKIVITSKDKKAKNLI